MNYCTKVISFIRELRPLDVLAPLLDKGSRTGSRQGWWKGIFPCEARTLQFVAFPLFPHAFVSLRQHPSILQPCYASSVFDPLDRGQGILFFLYKELKQLFSTFPACLRTDCGPHDCSGQQVNEEGRNHCRERLQDGWKSSSQLKKKHFCSCCP